MRVSLNMTKKKHQCPYCDYSTDRSPSELKRHVLRNHKEKHPEFLANYDKLFPKVQKKDLSFTCLQCGKHHKNPKHKKKFCNQSCAAKYNLKGREVSKEQKLKVSKKLKKYTPQYIERIFKENNFKTKKEIREYSHNLYKEYNKLKTSHPKLYKKLSETIQKPVVEGKVKTLKEWHKDIERIKKNALKCKTKSEFSFKYKNDYDKAREVRDQGIYPNIFDELYAHMEAVGNKKHRCIYAIKFPTEKKVYIGLTCNHLDRFNNHRKNSSNKSVKALIKKGIKYSMEIVVDYMPSQEASVKEGQILKEYEKKGWTTLNKSKTGGLGGNKVGRAYIIKKDIVKSITECRSIEEFKDNHNLLWKKATHHKVSNCIKYYFTQINQNPNYKLEFISNKVFNSKYGSLFDPRNKR